MIYDVQKASILKRLSAFILDSILLLIIATGIAYVSSLIFNVDAHQAKLQEYYDYYEETYNVKFDLTAEEFERLAPEEKAHYAEVEEILANDTKVVKEFNLVINLTLIVLFIGVLFAVLVVEFIIPLFLHNGQTIGKKIFAICLVNSNSVKITNVQLFVRALIGKFVVELMIPIYLIVMIFYGIIGSFGIIILCGILLLQIILLIFSQNKTLIHDVFAFTVVADKQTQMIFNSEGELIKYKEMMHKKSVATKTY